MRREKKNANRAGERAAPDGRLASAIICAIFTGAENTVRFPMLYP
jgi:hypothetical protein